MKRMKIVFTAIALVSVIGGTVAFKAAKFGSGNRYCTTISSTTCPTRADYNSNSGGSLLYCSSTSGGDCTAQELVVSTTP